MTEVTDATGRLVEYYTYDPYGNVTIFDASSNTIAQSAISNPYMFTGRRLDYETGLYYYRARMYDPTIGRFLQRDPLGYWDSMNLYMYVESAGKSILYNLSNFTNLYNYVNNNPINLLDPYGLIPLSLIPDYENDKRIDDLSPPPSPDDIDPCKKNPVITPEEPSTFDQMWWGLTLLSMGRSPFRIELHGTHGGRALPHLQLIRGPGWGKTIWRFPPH